MQSCMHCAKSKAKQKVVAKESKHDKSTKPGERIYLDLSKVTVSKSDEPDNMIMMESDPVSMADDATDEHSITNDASNDNTYTHDDDSTSNQRVHFVDDLDSNDLQASEAREGIIPSATVTLSGRMSKPPERL